MGIIEDVLSTCVASNVIALYKTLDTNYIIVDVKKTGFNDTFNTYYDTLNKKSLKQYEELTKNPELLKFNLDTKKDYFKIQYNDKIDIELIVKKLLNDIK